MNNQKSIDFNVIVQAFEIVKKQWQPFVTAGLLTFGAIFAVIMVFYMLLFGTVLVASQKPGAVFVMFPLMAILYLGIFFISALAQAGFASMALKCIRSETVVVSDFLVPLKTPVPFLLAALIVTVATMAGVVACIVGSYVAAGLLMFVFPFMIDKKLSPMDAAKASFEALKPQWLMAACFWLVAGIVGGLGGIACGVGAVFTLPITYVAMALVYRDLCMTPGSDAAAPVFVSPAETEIATSELNTPSPTPEEPEA